MVNESSTKFVIAVEAVTPHEDGGEVADFVGGVTNASKEEAESVLLGIYDFRAGGLSRRVRAARQGRNTATASFGKWSSLWDPHNDQIPRDSDGKKIYQ